MLTDGIADYVMGWGRAKHSRMALPRRPCGLRAINTRETAEPIMERTVALMAHGQSCWMDDLTRQMITSGELSQRVAEQGLRGITSNPSIFEKALRGGADYDADIARGALAGLSAEGVYEELVTTDVRAACDVLRKVYDEGRGVDGFQILEVFPQLQRD